MNSFNNEVCEFDSTPTTENFDGFIPGGKCGPKVSRELCEHDCKDWRWNERTLRMECFDGYLTNYV